MTKTPLAVDVDGVLLDWVSKGFKPYVEKRLGKVLNPNGPKDWDMSKWVGVSFQQTIDLIQDFNESEEFGQIPPFVCAKRVFPHFKKHGHPVWLISSCSNRQEVLERRYRNIFEKLDDCFDHITCLPLNKDKGDVLKEVSFQYGTGVWVEDRFENALTGAEQGWKTFIIRRSYNRLDESQHFHENITWVDDWFEIGQKFFEL